MLPLLHYHFVKIDSTQTWAKNHSHYLLPEALTVITADEQSAGRGRFRRPWISPRAVNLYGTFCWFMDGTRTDIVQSAQLMALTVLQVLEKLNFIPRLKWPNDLLLNGKKVAGILGETIIQGTGRWVFCGLGLNVNMTAEQLLVVDQPATSLAIERGECFSLSHIYNQICIQFQLNLMTFLVESFTPFAHLFAQKLQLIPGQLVRWQSSKEIIEGIFETVNPDGSICLRFPNGLLRSCFAGELIV